MSPRRSRPALPAGADRPEARRIEILTPAARLIAAHGYHGMSMRELAAGAGMSLANLYHYFPAKEDVLFALQTRAFETLLGAADAAIAGGADAGERLHAFILSHIQYVAGHPDVMHVLVAEAGELPEPRRRAVRTLKERYFAAGLALVREVVRVRDPRRRATGPELERATYSVFGMLNWTFGWYRPDRHGAPRELARTIHRIALSGLAGHAPDRTAWSATERRVRRVAMPSPIHRPRDPRAGPEAS